MTLFGLDGSIGALWLAAALVLGIAEMLTPGFFLIFVAAAAGITGLLVLAVPGVPLIAQALFFAAVTSGAVALGRRWYRGSDGPSADPLLNNRAARLIGKRVTVCDPIVGGAGRVTVDDGAWNAEGPDAALGETVRIVGARASVLLVEPA